MSLIKQTVTKDHIILLESESVNIENAFRRISSQAVTSCNDLPRCQVANKKGYALGVTKEVNEKEMKTNEVKVAILMSMQQARNIKHIFLVKRK